MPDSAVHQESSEGIKLAAPAKVNLGLRIVGRREDGYHLLESLFAPITLCDDVWVECARAKRTSVEISVEIDPAAPASLAGSVPVGPENLAARAARAFLEAAGETASIRIRLHKRIPAGGGLGGGSSDAAAVLRALARWMPDRISPEILAEQALALGADVPFFLVAQPAMVRGIGEEIQPIQGIPTLNLILGHPGEALSTPQVFRAWDALPSALTPSPAGSTMRALSGLLTSTSADVAGLAGVLGDLLENDLEPAAVRLCPPVRRLQEDLLRAGALATGMSGSGATVFGVFADGSSAAAGFEQLAPRAREWWHLAQTVA